ncbi:MAG: hypothetical protein H0V17_24400 [Deltaproteobacteria bacterium]|nr:hypothetical protein [Deltaproteobacteria bacterium]
MANGIPVRLSGDLTIRARAVAATLDRSLTEQVEHWARLGQVVEDAILATTVQRLKTRSYDADLQARVSLATTSEGRAKAAELIQRRNPVAHGLDAKGKIRVVRTRKPKLR